MIHALVVLFFVPLVFVHAQEADESWAELVPSAWVRLTEIDGEWVIYHYCFAGVPSIDLAWKDGRAELILFSGQDSELYDVMSLRKEGIETVLRVRNRYSPSDPEKKLTFRLIDENGEYAEWTGFYEGPTRWVLSGSRHDLREVYENDGNCEP